MFSLSPAAQKVPGPYQGHCHMLAQMTSPALRLELPPLADTVTEPSCNKFLELFTLKLSYWFAYLSFIQMFYWAPTTCCDLCRHWEYKTPPPNRTCILQGKFGQ